MTSSWMFRALVGVAAIGGVVWVVLAIMFNDSATPVSTEEAVEDFRAEALADAEPDADVEGDLEPEPVAAVPEDTEPLDTMPLGTVNPSPTADPTVVLLQPGVYLYATTGDEGIDALSGTRHTYPDVTAVTVQSTPCGTKYRWEPLEERAQEWELCRVEGGLELIGYTSFHKFFGQDDMRELRCDEHILLVPAQIESGATWDGGCVGQVLQEQWTVSVLGGSTQDVGGVSVDVVAIMVEIDVGATDNSTSGSYDATYWFTVDTGLLVGWEQMSATAADSAVGTVNYDEMFDLRLTDVRPET